LGYFQLFPELESALQRAIERGVKVRLVTNSALTNGLPVGNRVLGEALIRALELGVEVYATADPDQYKDDGAFCLHYKLAVFDGRAALVGSWNCIGTSVFYDSDFSVVMFDAAGDQTIFRSFEKLIDDSIEVGRVVQMKEVGEDFSTPFYYFALGSKSGIRQMKRGF
jgi:phosphatidylserine/phosphatidylglycerophosphate/cardiolipin synthase-like enzyme